jgi:menaquinol-cytochrome c reductase iron-sulfur subunit
MAPEKHQESDEPAIEPAAIDPAPPNRRSFFGLVLAGAGATIAGALMAIPLVRFALYPLFARTAESPMSDLGPVDAFSNLSAPLQKIISVSQRDGWRESVSEKPVYVVKDSQGQLKVFSTVCPHLGCEVPWNAEKQQFFCPCHGSSFSEDGTRLGGPTPRGLDSLPTTIQDGHLMVQYQYYRQLVPDKEVVG